MARTRIKVGDVFTLPLDDERLGFGQVVAKYKKDGYYFAIFDRAYSRSALPSASKVIMDRVAFLALSLDAKIFAGHWQIVGNEPVAPDLPMPAYKETVGTPDRVDVVDYSGAQRRRATADEAELLPYQTIVSPAVLEKALRAKHGLEPWHEIFDKLEPLEEATTARLFG